MHYKQEQCVSLFPRLGNHMSTMFFCLLLSTCKVKYFLNCLDTIPQNVIISDNCLPFFILYHYFLSSSIINCVNLRSDPEFKLIFTDAVLDFESIIQHPDNKNII